MTSDALLEMRGGCCNTESRAVTALGGVVRPSLPTTTGRVEPPPSPSQLSATIALTLLPLFVTLPPTQDAMDEEDQDEKEEEEEKEDEDDKDKDEPDQIPEEFVFEAEVSEHTVTLCVFVNG